MMKTTLAISIAGLLLTIPMRSQAQSATKNIFSSAQSPTARSTSTIRTVQLSLNDVVKLVLQGNRDLKNATLDRIVQKQELKEAESKFNPTFTPSLSLGINHQFLSSNGLSIDNSSRSGETTSGTNSTTSTGTNGTSSSSGNSLRLGNGSEMNYGAQLSMNWLSPIGTRLSMTTSPLSPQSIDLLIDGQNSGSKTVGSNGELTF
jgi:outer membrane protein TolC